MAGQSIAQARSSQIVIQQHGQSNSSMGASQIMSNDTMGASQIMCYVVHDLDRTRNAVSSIWPGIKTQNKIEKKRCYKKIKETHNVNGCNVHIGGTERGCITEKS